VYRNISDHLKYHRNEVETIYFPILTGSSVHLLFLMQAFRKVREERRTGTCFDMEYGKGPGMV
jgi:hypothetical protein